MPLLQEHLWRSVWDAYEMINEHADLRMLKVEQKEEGGTVDMCVALEEMARDWKEEGRVEERAEKELILQIVSRLLEAGEYTEAARITNDPAYREKVIQKHRNSV